MRDINLEQGVLWAKKWLKCSKLAQYDRDARNALNFILVLNNLVAKAPAGNSGFEYLSA
jgi:hypothetical protein